MSATATRPLFDLFAAQQPDSPVAGGGNLTLGERMSSVWEGLLRSGTAVCPVCRGHMERAGQRGVCTSCGTTLT